MTATAEGGAAAEVGSQVINFPVDYDWLGRAEVEDVLDPGRAIVDTHHHLWERPGSRYLPPDLLADIKAGHNIVATVYVENNFAYRSFGPEPMRPVGEAEVTARIGAGWANEPDTPHINAAIVGYADLCAGAAVRPVLEALVAAGMGRLRGIRQVTAWDPSPPLQPVQHGPRRGISAGMMQDPRFREGFAALAPLGLSFDAWLYHPQLGELIDLARAFPQTSIVLNHIGGPIGVDVFAGRDKEVFADWSRSITALAACPNVTVKVGGLAMRVLGMRLRERPAPPSSLTLAELWEPYVAHVIGAFGADRAMFESNFPVDKAYLDYRTLWNAFKRLAAGASEEERTALFSGTARRVYALEW